MTVSDLLDCMTIVAVLPLKVLNSSLVNQDNCQNVYNGNCLLWHMFITVLCHVKNHGLF
jgi:hypothetical protein